MSLPAIIPPGPAPATVAEFFHDGAIFPWPEGKSGPRPGASLGLSHGTTVVTMAGDLEVRTPRVPRLRYSVDLRDLSPEDFATVYRFAQARRGAVYGFRLLDWRDRTSHPDGISDGSAIQYRIPIGAGDGSTTTFGLVKRYADSGYIVEREITRPIESTVRVWVGGSEQTNPAGFTVDATTGIVTLATAPAEGVAVTAAFSFHVPVAFDESVDDRLEARRSNHDQDDPIPLAMTEIAERRDLPTFVQFGGFRDHGAFSKTYVIRPADGFVQCFTPLGVNPDLRLWDVGTQTPGGPLACIWNKSATDGLPLSTFEGMSIGTIPAGMMVEVFWAGSEWVVR